MIHFLNESFINGKIKAIYLNQCNFLYLIIKIFRNNSMKLKFRCFQYGIYDRRYFKNIITRPKTRIKNR